MLIRNATGADAREIAHVHVETWRSAYRGQIPDAVLERLDIQRRTAFFQERLTGHQGEVFVVEDGSGSIVGYCDVIASRDKDADSKKVAEIAAIYVLPQHWRKGAVRALCVKALAEARRRGYKVVTLWVLASNDAAKGFYKAMGFDLDETTKTNRMSDGHELKEVRLRLAI